MPLYACERCGFTSAAFRNDAVAAHRLEYPDCDGVMRIIFRSEERYRGQQTVSASAGAEATAPKTAEAEALPAEPRHALAMREYSELAGVLRLTLLGDLDLMTAETFKARLAELKAAGRSVRLDLSQLGFIDSTGIQALLAALTDARWTGWSLEVAPKVSPSVERAARIVGIAEVLWPKAPGTARSDALPSGPPPA